MKAIGKDFGDVARKTYAVASGALGNGKAVIVNADGTVSVISGGALGAQATLDSVLWEIPVSTFDSNSNRFVYFYLRSNQAYAVVGKMVGTTMSFGTPINVNSSGNMDYPAIAFDSNANKVLMAFRDKGDSNRGTCVVGTVDDMTMTLGTEAKFNASGHVAVYMALSFDSNANKFVLCFRDNNNSNYATARVCTISGTDVTFGTAVVFASSGTFEGSVFNEFNSSNNKSIIGWLDYANSHKAIVATISGTDVTFGTAVEYFSGSASYATMVFDASAGKCVVFYTNWTANPDVGNAAVATISGTDLSFATATEWTTPDGGIFDAAYNTDTGRTAIVYQAPSNNYAQVITGTVSGTSMSFGSPFLINSAVGNTFRVEYDTNTDRFGVGFGISGSTVGISFPDEVLNLTSENFIGITPSAYPDGAGAEIQTKGAINEQQSGLTAGQSYYVQTDGTLGLTAATPSVFAGTAVSATKIIVKG